MTHWLLHHLFRAIRKQQQSTRPAGNMNTTEILEEEAFDRTEPLELELPEQDRYEIEGWTDGATSREASNDPGLGSSARHGSPSPGLAWPVGFVVSEN